MISHRLASLAREIKVLHKVSDPLPGRPVTIVNSSYNEKASKVAHLKKMEENNKTINQVDNSIIYTLLSTNTVQIDGNFQWHPCLRVEGR